MNVIFSKLKGHGQGEGEGSGFLGMVGSLAQQFLQQKLEEMMRAMQNLHWKPLLEASKKSMLGRPT
ncbi:UNVERIFIED_CONTAM: hypothetical protein Sradi_6024200 [Sesamum radiatum]|uniref:Uncharacterized protein n=1 Tax=Sesamum radiatum TaxID=300843 RepID=A0AAW2KII4_SESRA